MNPAVVAKVAHDENDFRGLRPNGFRQILELAGIDIIHPFFVAEFQILQPIRLRMPVRDPPPSPFAVGQAIGILDEVHHVRRGFVDVEVGNGQKARRVA